MIAPKLRALSSPISTSLKRSTGGSLALLEKHSRFRDAEAAGHDARDAKHAEHSRNAEKRKLAGGGAAAGAGGCDSSTRCDRMPCTICPLHSGHYQAGRSARAAPTDRLRPPPISGTGAFFLQGGSEWRRSKPDSDSARRQVVSH